MITSPFLSIGCFRVSSGARHDRVSGIHVFIPLLICSHNTGINIVIVYGHYGVTNSFSSLMGIVLFILHSTAFRQSNQSQLPAIQCLSANLCVNLLRSPLLANFGTIGLALLRTTTARQLAIFHHYTLVMLSTHR